ncbi:MULTISPECIES: amino acid ABC transporter permease [Tepidibacillus]|nr:glutamine transport system permease protein GlnP [Tepidibacillus sp. HK-1]
MNEWSAVFEYRYWFFRGVGYTILLTSVGVSFGTIIGLFIGLGQLSQNRFYKLFSRIYVDLFRGTPLYVQILIVHFAVLPAFFGDQSPSAIFSGFVALSLNSGAYVAEIFRAGILSIDKGQMEAARSLGMSHRQAMRYIILPQAFKRMLPPLGNEFIALLKDSSLLAVIATPELTYAGQMTAKNTFTTFAPYLTIAAIYLILTLILSRGVRGLERKFSND